MISLDAHDLDSVAALFAAGASTAAERDSFAARLASGDRGAVAALAPYLPIVAELAELDAPIAPPPHLRAKLLERFRKEMKPAFVLHRTSEMPWESSGIPGVMQRVVFNDASLGRNTCMIRMDRGALFPAHVHEGIEELFVLEGDLEFGKTMMKAGDYQRFPAGSHHEVQRSPSGCTAIIITTRLVAA